jgi:hypothetical protein
MDAGVGKIVDCYLDTSSSSSSSSSSFSLYMLGTLQDPYKQMAGGRFLILSSSSSSSSSSFNHSYRLLHEESLFHFLNAAYLLLAFSWLPFAAAVAACLYLALDLALAVSSWLLVERVMSLDSLLVSRSV